MAKETNFSKTLERFIDLLFAIIIGVGFAEFLQSKFLKDLLLPKLPDFRIMALFIITYFYIISDWLFYYTLMKKYPYQKAKLRRFGTDIVFFFLMSFLIYLSTLPSRPLVILVYVFTLAACHLILFIWHVLAGREYPSSAKNKDCWAHIVRTSVYGVMGVFMFLVARKISDRPAEGSFTWIAVIVIGAGVVFFNLKRLRQFLEKSAEV